MRLTKRQFLSVINNTPLVSVDLLIRDINSRLLIGLRENEPAKGTWFVPGGRILKGESIHQALKRIVRTELGCEIDPSEFEFRGVFEHFYRTNFAHQSGVSTHYVVLGYETTILDQDLIQPDPQHSRFKWVSPDEAVDDSAIHPNTRTYCELYLERNHVSSGGTPRSDLATSIKV